MNIGKKILALLLVAQVSTACARLEYVAINRQELLQNSKAGKELRKTLEAEARELQEKQQKMIADVQQEEKELQKNLVAMNKNAQQDAITKLQKKAKKVQLRIQEMTNEFNEDAEARQRGLDEHNLKVAGEVRTQENWGMLVDKNITLALDPNLDVTPTVMAHLDAAFDKLAASEDSAAAAA